jgi:hypothetical protein
LISSGEKGVAREVREEKVFRRLPRKFRREMFLGYEI